MNRKDHLTSAFALPQARGHERGMITQPDAYDRFSLRYREWFDRLAAGQARLASGGERTVPRPHRELRGA